jgi:sensor histidine kinase regulating citrate/malate metabolism
VFKAGFSTKVPGDREHSRGIGLALVRRVVDRRDGEVVIGTGDLGGARMTVELPVPASVAGGRPRAAAGAGEAAP